MAHQTDYANTNVAHNRVGQDAVPALYVTDHGRVHQGDVINIYNHSAANQNGTCISARQISD